MKKYKKLNISSGLKNISDKNFYKYFFFLICKIFGIKYFLELVIFFIYKFFLSCQIKFVKKVIFNTTKYFNEYIYIETNSEKFILFTKDDAISRHYFVENSKKNYNNLEFLKFKRTINFLNNNFKKRFRIDTLFDVGANIGIICIPALTNKLIKKAYAVEPDPNNFKLLKINKTLNNLDDSLELYNYALSSKNNQKLKLQLSDDNYGDHRIVLRNPRLNLYNEESRKILTVKSKTFNSLFPRINPKKSIVWIDTQGFEPIIIQGAHNLLKYKVPIVVEFWPYGLKRNNLFNEMRRIVLKFDFFCDLAQNNMILKKINAKNVDDLFLGWDEEKSDKYSLYTDLLLIKK
jgi:FkbM family methyltransferase